MSTGSSLRYACIGASLLVIVFSPIWAKAGSSDADSSEITNVPIPELCFAPGTPLDHLDQVYQRLQDHFEKISLAPPSFLKHQIGTSWFSTATDGSGLAQGDPITLTWSVVPDGTPITSGAGEPPAASNLRAFLNGIYGSMPDWLPLFQQVFDRWGELAGITYIYVDYDDSAELPSFDGQLGVRADIRIGGHFIDGNSNIVAYNYYPDWGDMVIDTADNTFANKASNSLMLRNTVAHEHGHGLGFAHVCPIDQTKLMEPFISWLFDGPQHDDILAANRNYGDRFEHDDTPATAAPLGEFGSTTEANLSVDSNTDTDVYSFIVDADGEVDVTITPTGKTYLEGPQNPNGTCTAGSSYDTLTIQDLAVRVLDVDGSTELASADLGGVGEAEILVDVTLTSGAGTYYVEVTGDATDVAQLYELSMTLSPSDEIFSGDFESGDTTAWSSTVP